MKTYAKFERRDPNPMVPFSDESIGETPSLAEILGWVFLFACCIYIAIEMLNDGRIMFEIVGMVATVFAEVAALIRGLQ